MNDSSTAPGRELWRLELCADHTAAVVSWGSGILSPPTGTRDECALCDRPVAHLVSVTTATPKPDPNRSHP